jgi:hypothetical protein
VTFEPCGRSDWHTHPLGQTLVVTFGCGLHQRWGGPLEELRPGDVVTVGPNEKHWQGAFVIGSFSPPTIPVLRSARARGAVRERAAERVVIDQPV